MSFQDLFQKDTKAFSAGILSVGLVLAMIVVGAFAYSIRGLDYTLSVTGSAKEAVTADSGKWVVSFSRTVPAYAIKDGYAAMARDLETVKKFFAGKGVDASSLEQSVLFTEQYYGYGNDQRPASERDYVLRQTVTFRSSDVAKVTLVSRAISELVTAGVFATTQQLEYTYTKLPEKRIALLSAAVADARARAEQIAQSGGREVGDLRSAASGVVQVLPKGSVEISDYGAYDMSSVEKEVMVTVRATFSLE